MKQRRQQGRLEWNGNVSRAQLVVFKIRGRAERQELGQQVNYDKWLYFLIVSLISKTEYTENLLCLSSTYLRFKNVIEVFQWKTDNRSRLIVITWPQKRNVIHNANILYILYNYSLVYVYTVCVGRYMVCVFLYVTRNRIELEKVKMFL